jgi:hypothetical protein
MDATREALWWIVLWELACAGFGSPSKASAETRETLEA